MLRRSLGSVEADRILFTPTGTITSTTMQGAIVEALADARDYADAVAAGLNPKGAVGAATTSPLPANTRTGNVLTADVDGSLPNIDTSFAPIVGSRILVKDEVLGQNNGIYAVDSVGSPTSRWGMTRSSDADNLPGGGEVSSGMYTVATSGAHAAQGWVLSTIDPITLNTTPLAFVPYAVFSLAIDKLTQGSATNGQVPVWGGIAGSWLASTVQTTAGFETRGDSVLAFNDATREFTISPTGASYNVFLQNVKFNKSSPLTVTIPNVAYQLNYIYFDYAGVLQQSTSLWDLYTDLIAPVATLYWTGTLGEIGDERHHYQRSRVGTAYDKAVTGTAYATGLGGAFTNTTFSILPGTIWAQDMEITQTSTWTTARLWYRVPSLAMVFTNAQSTPYAKSGGGILQYDNAGTLTDVPATQHVKNWVYATNDVLAPISIVVSQDSGTLAQARAYPIPALPMPIREWKLLYGIIYKNVGGVPTFIESTDYRSTTQSSIYSTLVTVIPASNVSNIPAGNIASTDVQTALNELDTEKAALTGATFTGRVACTPVALTSTGGSLAINASLGNNFYHTTTEDTALAAPTSAIAGQWITITITQGATPRTLAYNTFYKFPQGFIPALTATAGAVDTLIAYIEQGATQAMARLVLDRK